MPPPTRTAGPVPSAEPAPRPAYSATGRPAWAGREDIVVDVPEPVLAARAPRRRRFAFTIGLIVLLVACVVVIATLAASG